MVKMFNYLLLLTANTWQKVNASRHVDVLKMTCWSSKRASEWGKKGDLCGFEHGMNGLI